MQVAWDLRNYTNSITSIPLQVFIYNSPVNNDIIMQPSQCAKVHYYNYSYTN